MIEARNREQKASPILSLKGILFINYLTFPEKITTCTPLLKVKLDQIQVITYK